MDIFKSWLVMGSPIAHRGFFNNKTIPENSLASFANAIKHNYSVELDVYVISDGTVVVFHDYELQRMTGKDGYITNLTKDELKNYHLLGTQETIPTLQEVFDLVNGQVPMLIEIKTSTTTKVGKEEAIILKKLREYKGDFAIQSFNPFTVEWFSKNAPDIWRGLLSSYWPKDTPQRPQSPMVRFALRNMIFARRAKPNFINHDLRQLPNRHTNRWKKIPLLSWVSYNQEDYIKSLKVSDNTVFQNFEPKI